MRRFTASLALGLALLAMAGCHRGKVTNPIADVNSKQPDKVLFDRSMEAMKKGKYDVARITLQTMINTYPDSEFVARAKLAVGDSWYAEGGTAALQQAEMEFKDFITFFPNMPEAAEAQLKVAQIHYRQMEKPDRDYTHAKRAEEEYRNLLMQWPDSKLADQAKQRLREVQEVLAEREYRIGRFYYLRESWAAAIARLKSVTDTYPLYSKADDALMLLAGAYEGEINAIRAAKANENVKGAMIAEFKKGAQEAYGKVITRYPVGGQADKAKERLAALNLPVPEPTQQAIAQNRAEEESRGELGKFGRVMMNFKKRPDVAETAKVGEPTLTEPAQTSAPEIVQQTTKVLLTAASAEATAQVVGQGKGAPPAGTPAPNQAAPRSEDAAAAAATPAAAGNPTPPADAQPKAAQPDNSGIQDLAATPGAAVTAAPAGPAPAQPAAGQPAAPAPPPRQVNDAAATPPSEAEAQPAPAGKLDKAKESSSSKGKKKKDKNKPPQ